MSDWSFLSSRLFFLFSGCLRWFVNYCVDNWEVTTAVVWFQIYFVCVLLCVRSIKKCSVSHIALVIVRVLQWKLSVDFRIFYAACLTRHLTLSTHLWSFCFDFLHRLKFHKKAMWCDVPACAKKTVVCERLLLKFCKKSMHDTMKHSHCTIN